MNIEFRDIHVELEKKEILKGVSLKAEHGKITGLAGPNGCGKSTLIKTVFGIISPKQGEIILDGRSLHSIGKKKIASMVGYVGQDTSCVFDFTVTEVISMALYQQKEKGGMSSKDRIAKALEELHISHMADRSILTLSGGERKMVFLARAVAQGVDTIILDEPTNHLDIKHQLFIMDYLKRSGHTILIVLHDLRLAAHYCDELYLLRNGENICKGSPLSALESSSVQKVFEVKGHSFLDQDGSTDFYLHMKE